LCGAETWTLRRADQKYLGSFEMWCWRRTGKMSWTDRVKNEEVLHRVKGERNIVHTVNRRKANRIGHILCRSCLLKHVSEGKIEERRGRRRKQLLDDLKEKRGYWELKEEAQDRTLWRTGFGRDCGSVDKTDCGMNFFLWSANHEAFFYAVFPAACCLIPLRPKYFPQHPFLEDPQPIAFPQFEIPSFTPVQNNR